VAKAAWNEETGGVMRERLRVENLSSFVRGTEEDWWLGVADWVSVCVFIGFLNGGQRRARLSPRGPDLDPSIYRERLR